MLSNVERIFSILSQTMMSLFNQQIKMYFNWPFLPSLITPSFVIYLQIVKWKLQMVVVEGGGSGIKRHVKQFLTFVFINCIVKVRQLSIAKEWYI